MTSPWVAFVDFGKNAYEPTKEEKQGSLKKKDIKPKFYNAK